MSGSDELNHCQYPAYEAWPHAVMHYVVTLEQFFFLKLYVLNVFSIVSFIADNLVYLSIPC